MPQLSTQHGSFAGRPDSPKETERRAGKMACWVKMCSTEADSAFNPADIHRTERDAPPASQLQAPITSFDLHWQPMASCLHIYTQ